jgi:hypothetical protein
MIDLSAGLSWRFRVPEENAQQVADRVNLGPHQTTLTVEDESGNPLRFVVHRPTMRDQLRIGVATANLISTPTTVKDGETQVGGIADVPTLYAGLAEAVATLNVVVDLRPAGVSAEVGEWLDATLTWNLFAAYGEWLDSFRQPVSPASGSDSPTPEPAAPGLAV